MASRIRFSAVAALTVSLVVSISAVLALAGFLYAPTVHLESRDSVGFALVHVSAYVGIAMFALGILQFECRFLSVHPVATAGWFAVAAIMAGNSIVTFATPSALSFLLGMECAVFCLFSYWYFLRS